MADLDDILLSSPSSHPHNLFKRVKIPTNKNSSQELLNSLKQDPFSKSDKYALGFVYFGVVLFVFTFFLYWYHYWNDKIGRANFKEELEIAITSKESSPDIDYEMAALPTNNSQRKFFPRDMEIGEKATEPQELESTLAFGPLNKLIALTRFIVYRPLPTFRYYKRREFSFPGLGAIAIIFAATAFVALYTFLPQPYYYKTIAYGSPPLAIRSGMLAVAMMPWIVALSMKANIISWMTGIGHERLNVLHRWGAYIMLFLSLVHTVPFYITPVWDQGGLQTFKNLFHQDFYIYGTGLAALIPLGVLCLHSLPILRTWMYELFVTCHVPISIVYLGMLFWHCHNYLTSWHYLWATVGIWVFSWIARIFYLNWTNPRRLSWLIGEEASITLLPENAVKVTVATQVRWKPGQYVYLRIPGVSIFENHPFTIASLWSEDFPSDYGEEYKDMALVFRPFSGFTRKVVNTALQNGPDKTYRAFIDGPYGGMRRDLASFDTVVLFAGGSGITAIVSQLLNLIKKMRDSRAVTKQVHVIWALKRPETLEWFKEELRICKEFAPPESVHCQFYITAAKRVAPVPLTTDGRPRVPPSPSRPFQNALHKQIDETFQGIASKRNSALIMEASAGDPEKEAEMRAEAADGVSGLPHPTFLPQPKKTLSPPSSSSGHKSKPSLSLATKNLPSASSMNQIHLDPNPLPAAAAGDHGFDFGFPSTPTMLQKSIMRFAFMPSIRPQKSSWSTEYGRPDIPFMLKDVERSFGKRTCVFVCGPPGMRVDVQKAVAGLQRTVWSKGREEIYLHTENYAL